MKGTKKIGVPFEKGDPRINREGRPKSIYTVLKEKGFCSNDIKTAMKELVFHTEKELEEISENTEKPIIIRIIAQNIIEAMLNGSLSEMRIILEHTIGVPNQKIEQNTTVSFDPKTITDAELKEINHKLENLV